jgi:2-oxo-4-hydroxy-4-carboxy-5-ureidoimidazoline decarboxylase
MPRSALTLDQINTADHDTFVTLLGWVFEGSPWVAAGAWAARPFADGAALHAALCAVMGAAPPDQQIALIRAHPDLVGRAALAGTLTPESTHEQAAAGLDRLTPAEQATFAQLNARYRARFGFPFVLCARENKKASILAGFAARLDHSRDEEIATALAEIAKIARLRLGDVLEPA